MESPKQSTTPKLPSLSALTGTIRPGTTATHMERATMTSVKELGRSWMEPPAGLRAKAGEAGSLSEASTLASLASRHADSLSKAPRSPYKRVLTPEQKEQARKQFSKKLEQVMGMVAAARPAPLAVPSEQGPDAPAECASPTRGGTPRTAALRTPGSPGRLHEIVMQQPSSRLASSWSGPLSGLAADDGKTEAATLSRLSTPKLRASSPMLSLLLATANSRPITTGSALSPSRLQHASSAPRLISTSASDVWVNPNDAASAPPALTSAAARSNAASMAGTSTAHNPVRRGGGTYSKTTVARPLGAVEAVARPTRGTMFSVFQDLDVGGDGRLTYSMFETAALHVGWKEEMARRLFDKLDTTSKGYATMSDWGGPEVEQALSKFTRLYCQRTRGEGGRYKDSQEIDNLWSAMQMALERLKLKNHGRSISHDKIVAAFEFIDHNKSGTLDKAELFDAFNGLGVYVTADVLNQAMTSLDRDNNGSVDYSEFVMTLFPVLGKSFKPE
ncbi:hypothetical protein FOA52_005600 [Chlamydomonas sp. UWO 241]|nr:hypothetical protein FOA52_005600 [Chlamydomonas sp. UWO 241]